MRKENQKWTAIVLMLVIFLTGCGTRVQSGAENALAQTGNWLMEAVPEPAYGSVGGEWTVLGLARSGLEVPEAYFSGYYERFAACITEMDGVLTDRKYTEYSRVILALTAVGKDPSDVNGYNLLAPLSDFDRTVFQGINGPIYALLALDCGNYEIPETTGTANQATREQYVDYILSRELPGGGWSFAGGEAEADITAMALQALAKYRHRQEVADAVDRGLEVLSRLQNESGGFTAYDSQSCESVAQGIVALTELGIAIDDSRFVKNGNTLLDRLLEFRTEEGAFRHVLDGDADLMASEQAFYALTALERAEQGDASLYTMTEK